MIELHDWTAGTPTELGWYAYRCPDPTTGFELAFRFDFVFVKIFDQATKGDRNLCTCLPILGDVIPVRIDELGGEWCGPFVMGE